MGAVCSTEDVAQDKVRETKVREEEEVGSEGASRIRKWLRWRRWEERAAWGFAVRGCRTPGPSDDVRGRGGAAPGSDTRWTEGLRRLSKHCRGAAELLRAPGAAFGRLVLAF